MSDWTGVLNKLGGGAEMAGFRAPTGEWNWDRIGQTLGMAGAAISPEGSWQRALGGVGATVGTSNIYSKAQAKASERKNAYMRSLINALGGLTEDGVAGPTTYTENADGTFSIKGNVGTKVPGVTPQTKVGGVGTGDLTLSPSAPIRGDTLGDTTKMSPSISGEFGRDPYEALIRGLGNFQDSSAGLTSADYAGLTPEQIDALAGRQLQGQELGLRTLDFLNEILGPKEGEVVEGLENYMLVDRVKGTSRDLGIPVYRTEKAPTFLKTAQGYMAYVPGQGLVNTGLTPFSSPKRARQYQVQYYDPKTGKPGSVLVDENSYNQKIIELQQQGFVVGNAPTPRPPGEIAEDVRFSKDAYVNAFEGSSDEIKKKGVSDFNNYAPDSTGTFLYWDTTLGDEAMEVRLPPGVTLGKVRERAKANKMTVDEYASKMGWIK